MKLYLDTANIEDIKLYNSVFRIDGVTTNPSIICKEKPKSLDDILIPIINELDEKQLLFVEVISNRTDDIISEAKQIIKYRKNTIPKIPVSIEGLVAIRKLSDEGIDVLATAIMQASQAYLAINNGAKYIAPYYNRMGTYDDSFKQISLMQKIIDQYHSNSEIVGAGFHTVKQVEETLSTGVESITVTIDILKQMYMHEGTSIAIKGFEDKWKDNFNRSTLL